MKEKEISSIKFAVKEWITELNKTEKLPDGIIALNFGLFEPYGIELIGSENYDSSDDDWACDEDFVPSQRSCPNITISKTYGWEMVLEVMAEILKELVSGFYKFRILQSVLVTEI